MLLGETRCSVSINWVACGTCYTKTEGTELGGIEGPQVMLQIKKREKKKKKRLGIQQVLLVIPTMVEAC